MSMTTTDELGETNSAHPAPIPRSAWLSLLAVVLGVFVVMLDGTVLFVANPAIANDLGASPAGIQWVTNAYALVLAGLMIPLGNLADRFGRKRMFLLGVGGFSLASLLAGLSFSIGMLIAVRVLQAAFGAMLIPAGMGVLRAAFPPERLARAMGVFAALAGVSFATGPIIGGLLVQYASWPWVFFINLPFGVIGVLIGGRIIAESGERHRQNFDLLGAASLTVAMVSLIWGITQAQEAGWTSPNTLIFVLLGLAFGGVFILIERKVAHPMMPLELFRNRTLSLGSVLMVMVMFSMLSLLFFVIFLLQGVLGQSAIVTGLGLLPFSVMFALISPFSGILTEKFGVRRLLVLGALLFAGGLLLMLRVDTSAGVLDLLPTFVLSGLGLGFMMVSATQAIVGSAPVEKAGVASGLQQSMTQLGASLSTSVLGSVLAMVIASDFAGTLRRAFGGQGGPAVDALGHNQLLHKSVELGFSPAAESGLAKQLAGSGLPQERAEQVAATVAKAAPPDLRLRTAHRLPGRHRGHPRRRGARDVHPGQRG